MLEGPSGSLFCHSSHCLTVKKRNEDDNPLSKGSIDPFTMKRRKKKHGRFGLWVKVAALLLWQLPGVVCFFLNHAAPFVVPRRRCRSNKLDSSADSDADADADAYTDIHSCFRRQMINTMTVSATAVLTGLPAQSSYAAADSLGTRLAKRDASVLQNRLFNVPPSAQVYPDWMHGNWKVRSRFSGYLFPSTTISKQRLTQNFSVAGFQKCSIAATADVGKENVQYNFRIDPNTGLEDRAYNFQQQIDAYLGYKAVQSVVYDGNKNPNRLGIDFVDYRTTNAERVELFCNARESEQYYSSNDNLPVFVCGEYVRQVTFGTGSTVGIPRQVVTNYANFWTWRPVAADSLGSSNTATTRPPALKGNLLTCAYLDPQDPMYFEEPKKPVAVYSHQLTAEPIAI